MSSYEEVHAQVLDRVTPTPDEYDALADTLDTLINRAHTAITERDITAELLHTGSTARDTWIRGARDIDIFLQFPTTLTTSDLESLGLELGHTILDNGTEEYAEHPYVTGTLNDFDVDIVPCYEVDSPNQIVSSVDRTPFHTMYLDDHLTEDLADETRVFKQFLTGINVYGSDLRTQGFSGYLTELLILHYTTTHDTLCAASDWSPPVHIDIENHAKTTFNDPLVVIDPTDPTRNVAAVLSEANVARFQHYARDLLANPRTDLFFPDPPDPLTTDELTDHITRRNTTPLAIVFDTPDLVDDELYPQLRKSLTGIANELTRADFDIVRKTVFSGQQSVLFFELTTPTRPTIHRHDGPPVAVRNHATAFLDKYEDTDVYGPFIDNDRYVIERDRPNTHITDYIENKPFSDLRLGPAVKTALDTDYDLLIGPEVTELVDEFATDLTAYFDPNP